MMTRIALRAVRAHPVRFLLTVLAVALGVGFVVGTLILRSMMSTSFSTLVDSSVTGDAYVLPRTNIAVTPDSNGVPASLVPKIAAIPEVKSAVGVIQGPVVLIGGNGTPVGSFGPPSMAMQYQPSLEQWHFVTGGPPSGNQQIALDEGTAARAGLSVGATTQVVTNSGAYEVKVSGIATFSGPTMGAVIVLVDQPTAQLWFNAKDTVSQIVVKAQPGTTQDALAVKVSYLLDKSTTVTTGADRKAEVNKHIDTGLGFVSSFLLLFAAIALFVGAFSIANTFTMTLRERARELALLRALGASPLQVLCSVLIQALVVGVIGAGIGVGLGIGLVYLVHGALARFGLDMPGNIPVSITTVAVAVGVGIVVCVLASLIPGRRAALTSPLDAMRSDEPSAERPLLVRALIGAIFIVAGVGAVVAAIRDVVPDYRQGLLGAGAVLTLIGSLAVAPSLGRVVLWLLVAPFRLIRPLGRLAAGNLVRNPRRTANAASALVIGMALVSASATLAATMESSTRDLVRSEITSPFIYQSMTLPISPELVQETAKLADVSYVYRFTVTPAMIAGKTRLVDGVDMRVFGDAFDVPVVSGNLKDVGDGEIALRADEAGDLKVGNIVRVEGPAGAATLKVAAIIDSKTISVFGFVTDKTMSVLNPAPGSLFTFIGSRGGDQAALRTQLENLARPWKVVSVIDSEQLVGFVAAQVNKLLAIMYALLGLSVVIAFVGVVNTLALSVMERTREIALLRAVGLGRAQNALVIGIESVAIVLFGIIFGMLLGLGLASAVQQVFTDVGLSVLAIPWAQLAVMVGVGAFVGLLAAIWPAIRAARLPVLGAVTQD